MAIREEISEIGFRDVRSFQTAWNFGERLAVDGICGPLTLAAAGMSLQRRKNGLPDLSEHFSAAELACRCRGRLPGCRGLVVARDLLPALESLRSALGRPIEINSGYRCPQHNALVGGARESQHIAAAAADIGASAAAELDQVRALAIVSGIGWQLVSGRQRVVHVDVRRTATPDDPTVWEYGPDGRAIS